MWNWKVVRSSMQLFASCSAIPRNRFVQYLNICGKLIKKFSVLLSGIDKSGCRWKWASTYTNHSLAECTISLKRQRSSGQSERRYYLSQKFSLPLFRSRTEYSDMCCQWSPAITGKGHTAGLVEVDAPFSAAHERQPDRNRYNAFTGMTRQLANINRCMLGTNFQSQLLYCRVCSRVD